MMKLDTFLIHKTEVAPLDILVSNLVTLKMLILAACSELTRTNPNLLSKICAQTVLLDAYGDKSLS